ncbi:MAG: hemolysin III family protein [Clostridia bacterium]|nr:hemolysin III family protein [Clostridia bacterium]
MRTKRTKLTDRTLPDYTRGEEIFNMVSHIVGGAFGIVALVTCVVKAFCNHSAYQVVGAFIYGFSMILLYTMSSIYHGLIPEMAKKVMQVIDHCTVFILIAGTYTPIALTSLRQYSTPLGWTVFGVVWGVSALGITLNAIDLKKYSVFSAVCYLALGWCIVFTGKSAVTAIGKTGFLWLLAGGIAYTVGAVLYGIAGKSVHRYMHSVFHIFVVIGSILQYVCVLFYVLVE